MSDHRRVRSRDVGDGGLLHQPLLAPLRLLRLLTSTCCQYYETRRTQPLFFFDDDDLFFVTSTPIYITIDTYTTHLQLHTIHLQEVMHDTSLLAHHCPHVKMKASAEVDRILLRSCLHLRAFLRLGTKKVHQSSVFLSSKFSFSYYFGTSTLHNILSLLSELI